MDRGPSAFHHFSKLPAELQLRIWELAVRDDRPAVHFLTSSRRGESGPQLEPNLRCAIVGHGITEERAAAADHRCSAPKCPEAGGQSWTVNNRSGYMLDIGLWTACRDSRQAVIRDVEARRKVEKYYDGWIFRGFRQQIDLSPCSTGFFSLDQARVYFTMRAHDLICLQSIDNKVSSIGCGLWQRWYPQLFYTWHYGVEFDPSWEPPPLDCDPEWRIPGDAAPDDSAIPRILFQPVMADF